MATLESQALLLQRVDYGESDVVVTLLTEAAGKVGALARGARKSARRFAGALEPFHTLTVSLEERRGELLLLREAQVTRLRLALTGRLEAVEAAGAALRWARHLLAARQKDAPVWALLEASLDELEARAEAPADELRARLARVAFRLLAVAGYALDLEACVVCGRPCPKARPAALDLRRGGLVCQSCGGGPRVLGPRERAVARSWLAHDGDAPLEPALDLGAAGIGMLLAIAEEAMAVHADLGQ